MFPLTPDLPEAGRGENRFFTPLAPFRGEESGVRGCMNVARRAPRGLGHIVAINTEVVSIRFTVFSGRPVNGYENEYESTAALRMSTRNCDWGFASFRNREGAGPSSFGKL